MTSGCAELEKTQEEASGGPSLNQTCGSCPLQGGHQGGSKGKELAKHGKCGGDTERRVARWCK